MACINPQYSRRQPENSVLHKVFKNHWLEFIDSLKVADSDRNLRGFVVKEVEDYYKCGILSFGFARFFCKDCKKSQVVAFSCKRRGFCPSCCARRMNLTSAHLVDEVFPHVRVRQWVMSFPFSLRYLMAYDPKLISQVLKIFMNVTQSWYRLKARQKGIKKSRCGAVTVIQRAGGALNSNVHFHSLFIDGVYTKSDSEAYKFHFIKAPEASDLEELAAKVRKRVIRLLEKKGYLNWDESDCEEHSRWVGHRIVSGYCALRWTSLGD